MSDGLGYVPGGAAVHAATKPVSGDRIVTSLERLDAIQDHGTKKGYDDGCRGSHCPGKESVGMSCSQASIRYAGDMGYRRRVDAGVSAEDIWAEDQAAHVVMPKPNAKDRRGGSVWDGDQLTVEDSVAEYEAEEDERLYDGVAPAALVKAPTGSKLKREATQSVPQQPAGETAVGDAERPAAAPARKWGVRRVWVAVSPDGKLHGPHESREAAFAVVESALRPKKATMPKPKVDDGKPKRVRRPWTEQDTVALKRLHADGLSGQKIAQQMGRLPQVVLQRLRMMGLQTNGISVGRKS